MTTVKNRKKCSSFKKALKGPFLFLFFIISLASCSADKSPKEIVIHAPVSQNIKGLDPAYASDNYTYQAVSQLYEGLYHYHYTKRPLTVQPLLAESMPSVSKDGLEYTIKIRPGTYFVDDPCFRDGRGRELVAKDFIYSWKRLSDPKTVSPGAWVFKNNIKGLKKWSDGIAGGNGTFGSPVDGFEALDKYTIRIRLTTPLPHLTSLLTLPFTMAVPQEAVEKYGNEFGSHAVGTGAFKLSNWIRGSSLTMVRNEKYRETYFPSGAAKSKKNRIPFADKVVLHVGVDDQAIWLSFLNEKLDFTGIPRDSYAAIFTEKNKLSPELLEKNISYQSTPRLDVTYFGFNMDNPILGKNKKLRKALALAIDRQALLKVFYNGRGIIAKGPVPPTLSGHKESQAYSLKHNLEMAKKYLTDAGFPDGKGVPPLTYESQADTWHRQLAEFVQNQFAQIGVKINIRTNSWPQYEKKVKNRKADIFFMGWNADYPDVENFMQLFYGGNISPGSNASNFNNEEYNKLYEKFRTQSDPETRKKLISQMSEILADEVPVLFNIHRIDYHLKHSALKNFHMNSVISDYYKYLSKD